MAKPWRQSKVYCCPSCQTIYLHDGAYAHHLFRCPNRPKPAVRLPVKIYCPAIGQD